MIAWASAKIIMDMANKWEKNFLIAVTDVCDFRLWKASHSNVMTRYLNFRPMYAVEIWGTDGTWAVTDIMQVKFVKKMLKKFEKLRQMVQQSGKLCTESRRGKILQRAAWCCYKIVRIGEDKDVSRCEWQIGKFILWIWSLSLKEEFKKKLVWDISAKRGNRVTQTQNASLFQLGLTINTERRIW